MSSALYYYANEQNQPVGPFTVDQLTTMIQNGLVTDSTLVCIADGSDWIPLEQVTGTASSSPSSSQTPGSRAGTAGPSPRPAPSDAQSSYQKKAETVGMIPDLSGKRNLLQLVITIPVVLIFALWGLVSGGMEEALYRGLIGLFVGVGASGAVLMVLGWKRRQ